MLCELICPSCQHTHVLINLWRIYEHVMMLCELLCWISCIRYSVLIVNDVEIDSLTCNGFEPGPTTQSHFDLLERMTQQNPTYMADGNFSHFIPFLQHNSQPCINACALSVVAHLLQSVRKWFILQRTNCILPLILCDEEIENAPHVREF